MHSCRLSVAIVTLVALSCPTLVLAHERWFAAGPYPTTDWPALVSLPVMPALISSLAIVGALGLARRWIDDPLWPRPKALQRPEIAAPAIPGVQSAITLIYEATHMHLFAPNIDLEHNAIGYCIAGLAIVAGFTFITGVVTRIGALVIIARLMLGFA